MTPTENPAWKKLAALASQIREKPLAQLIDEPGRSHAYTFSVAGCRFDFGKQRIDGAVMSQLLQLAEQRAVLPRAADMFAGRAVNVSEGRAALHSALRDGAPDVSADIRDSVSAVRTRLLEMTESIRDGRFRGYTHKPITDVVHIGIGGSNLGPELAVAALADFKTTRLNLHFVANIDANDLHSTLSGLNPETTLFVVVSKSFGTLETLINAESARHWFMERTCAPEAVARHFIGVTSNVTAALEFGLNEDHLFPLWDWVGGRYSLWSAVGIPVALSIGAEHFGELLRGAREVDQHFANTPATGNIPLLAALFAIWNYNFLGAGSLAVLCYDERLKLLPDYLQQLEMESNGKSVSNSGEPVAMHTMGVLWGGTGTPGQHAYHQLLHQGTRAYAADFIVVRQDDRHMPEHHNWLLANALAQSQAMATGYQAQPDEPHKQVAGDHPSTTIVLDTLAPRQLGALLAIYEHKVFCQGILWDINSFDQWGVELGKRLAEPIYAALAGAGQTLAESDGAGTDEATRHLLRYLLNNDLPSNKREDTP